MANRETKDWKWRASELEADQREALRAVLHHFGPDGANVVSRHILDARKARANGEYADSSKEGQ